jgi:hypothetical protein
MILYRFYSCAGVARHVPVLCQPAQRDAAAKGQLSIAMLSAETLTGWPA